MHASRLDGARASLAAPGPLMEPNRLADLAADRENRIQRGHRLLKDHRDLRAANRAHLRFREFQQIDAVEQNHTAGDTRAFREQAHDR